MFLVCGEALFDFFLESEEGPARAHLRGARRRLALQRRRSGWHGSGSRRGC